MKSKLRRSDSLPPTARSKKIRVSTYKSLAGGDKCGIMKNKYAYY
jgi:hypothetical protein